MVEDTKGNPVASFVGAVRLGNRQDVRAFKKFKLDPAHRAAVAISAQNTGAKI